MILTLENNFNSRALWEMILTLENNFYSGALWETIFTLGHSGKLILTLEHSRVLWERNLTLATLSKKKIC